MPIKLNVGASRKVGENNYGSRGASINLELELDASLVNEPARLQERMRHLFGLIRVSLAEELNGSDTAPTQPAPRDPTPPASNGAPHTSNGAPHSNGRNGVQRSGGGSRPATPAQIKALYGIARRQGLDLAAWLRERTRVARPDDLTLHEASQLIDDPKGSATSAAD